MLVKTNYQNKKNSIYKCDMCNKSVNGLEVVQLLRKTKDESYKKEKLCDLCDHCYRLIRRSVINYRSKRGD